MGDLCDFQRGLTYSKADEVELSANVVLRANNINLETNRLNFDNLRSIDESILVPESRKVKRDSLMICTASGSKSHLGKVAYIDDDYGYAFGGFMGLVTPKAELVPKYLFHLMTSPAYKNFIDSLSDGANINNLRFDDLAKFPVPFPSTVEQAQIVAILDEAFEGIATAKANAEKNREAARSLITIAIDAAIKGYLSSSTSVSSDELVRQISDLRATAIRDGKVKGQRPEAPEQEMPWPFELPGGWNWTRLDDICVGITDGVHKKPEYISTGVPFVTVRNLTAGPGISFDDLNYISQADHEEFIKRTHPEKGDILITKDGTIGVVRLIETETEFSIFVSVALIKPATPEIAPYLAFALRAACVQEQIVRKGAALKHLYLVDLRQLAIPLPPLAIQRSIVESLNSISVESLQLESVYQRKIAALDELKKSLLDEAFAGQLSR